VTRRAAIYARFSTAHQNPRSIEDQEALCRAYAAREGLAVVAVFADRALTGTTRHDRDGLAALLEAAGRGEFEVLLAEQMARVGRDEEDRAHVRKRLRFLGVVMMTPADGVVSPLVDGIRAVVDSQQAEDLKGYIRRGQAGLLREGRVPGSIAYGYRAANRFDASGKPIRGLRAIDEAEAEVVRRIFREYGAGRTPREIAKGLNDDGVPPPRGRKWNASTINCFGKRVAGILLNPLYAGLIVYNRTRKPRDPDTGRRVSRPNPAGERTTGEAPHLRIVDEELWQAVQARKAAAGQGHPHMQRRPRHLLSGLLGCGHCGAGLHVKDRDRSGQVRVACVSVLENGGCPNPRTIYLPAIERAVVQGLKRELKDPRAIEVYVRRWNERRRSRAIAADRDRVKLERRLAEIDRELERARSALIKGLITEDEAELELPRLRAERAAIAADLASVGSETNVVALHPGVIERYIADVEALEATLARHAASDAESSRRLTATLRSLIVRVTVTPFGKGEGFEVEVTGRLSELVGEKLFPSGGSLVPQEGFEPPTPSLRMTCSTS
jgi:site-specific DNA recombinase